jgi:ribosome modulation factor
MIKPFTFFRGGTLPEVNIETVSIEVQMIARSIEHIPVEMVYVSIANEEYEGWSAHMDNLSPGQCPYDIRTIEREHWMTGWSNREDYINR